jgi:hypothetical protein
MGNARWMLSCLSNVPPETEIHELGAGDGCLLGRLAAKGFRSRGYDLAPRPAGLSEVVSWQQGDFLEEERSINGVVVGTFVLHHFEEDSLYRLGRRIAGADLKVREDERSAMEKALLLHKEYYSDEERMWNDRGAISIPLTAMAVIAKEVKGYQLTIKNEYIPDWIINVNPPKPE